MQMRGFSEQAKQLAVTGTTDQLYVLQEVSHSHACFHFRCVMAGIELLGKTYKFGGHLVCCQFEDEDSKFTTVKHFYSEPAP